MITTKKIKIWTIVTHGLITIGAGHGIIFLFIIEVLFFPYVTKDNFNLSFNGSDNHSPIIGLTTFLGQAALLFSILTHRQRLKDIFQIIGLCLLWLSIVYFTYDAGADNYIHISLLTVIPFAICTIIAFAGQPLKKLYNWILD